MPDDSQPAPRRSIPPLMDRLGELCVALVGQRDLSLAGSK